MAMRQTPNLIDSVDHGELLTFPVTLIPYNTCHKERMTPKVANGLDSQLDYT